MIIILYPSQISIFFFALKELFYRVQSRVRLNCQRTFVMSVIHIVLYKTAVYTYCRKVEFNYHALEPFY